MGRQNGARRRHLAFALTGIAGGIVGIALLSTVAIEALALTVVIVLGALVGWWAALAASIIQSIHAVAVHEWWHLPGPLLAAALAVQILRKGARPTLAVVPLFLALALSGLLSQEWQADYVAIGTTALVLANALVAAAVLLLWIMPRRGRHLPARARLRWDHLLFVLINGSVAFAAIVLLPDTILATTPRHDGTLDRLLWLTLFAEVVGFGASKSFELASEAGGRQLLEGLIHGKPSKRSLKRMPQETAAHLLAAVRNARRVCRAIERLRSELEEARRELNATQQLRKADAHLLKERSDTLARTLRAYGSTRAQLGAIMRDSPEPILFVDAHKRIERVNQAALRVLGYRQDELVGKPIGMLTPATYIGEHPFDLTVDEAAPSTPQQRQVLVAPIQCAGGTERKLSIRMYSYVVANAQHHLVQLRDPNQTKQALAALARARAALAQAHRSRNEVIGSMSHEFRTPLHGIIAMLDMLRDEDLSANGRQRLAVAKSSARSLLKLANDVLDWTRVESSKLTFERRPFDIVAIIREVFAEVTPQAATKKISLSLAENSNLPPSLIGDPQRVKQIIGNLVTNAVKFSREGEVCVRAGYADGQCTIDVVDTGPGIPPDKYEEIFKPFVRGHENQRLEGAGLGLAICRQICEGMGGKLRVLDSSPAGSTFRFTAPLEASDEVPEDEQSQRIFRNLKGRILVVEDHPTNQFVVKSMLDALKCEATIASNGLEALEALERKEFDLILMDCRMPGIDGLETTRRIRKELGKTLPIIAMTANTMPEDIEECRKAGMNDYLAKPFGRSALHDVLCKWLKPETKSGDQSVTQRLAAVPVVDEAVFNELFENLKWQKPPMRRICDTFLDTARSTVRLLDGPSSVQLGRNLHTLRGTAGMIGARQIEHLTILLQEAVNGERAAETPRLRKKLASAIESFERDFVAKVDAE